MDSTPGPRKILDAFAAAVLYVVLARLGQLFAMEPGNITPVWLPSGVFLALVVLRGHHLLPGVFLGAMLGNGWAYTDLGSLSAALPGVLAAVMNGVGDTLCVLVGVWALDRSGGIVGVFRSIRQLATFLGFGALGGSVISAVFGMSGMYLAGAVPASALFSGFTFWVLGDAVGVMLLAPLMLSFTVSEQELPEGGAGISERLGLLVVVLAVPLVTPLLRTIDIEFRMDFMVAPLLLVVLLRAGLRAGLLAPVCLVAVHLILLNRHEALGLSMDMTPFVLQLLIAVNVASVLVVGALLWQQREMLRRATEEATHDALTGLWNRRSGIPRLEKELARAVRYATPLSVVLFDIDLFKEVNDNHGHAAGDAVLRDLSSLADRDLRETDMLARWGGEEFLLMLPGTNLTGARTRAERLRTRIAETTLGGKHRITISAGVAELERGMGVDDLLAAADRALYTAKENGRNRTELASPVRPA